MTELITCLSSGKGTWSHVVKLVKNQEWEKIFIITNEFGKDKFIPNEKMTVVIINENWSVDKIIDSLKLQMSEKIIGPEIAFNMVSGSGKEHMAILSALLKMGLGIRLVYMDGENLKEL